MAKRNWNRVENGVVDGKDTMISYETKKCPTSDANSKIHQADRQVAAAVSWI